jgi:DNA (cytosine-5)-methyltransferase 1
MTKRTDEQVTWSDLGLWSGKTCPEHSAATKDKTSRQSSKRSSASQSRKPPILKCLKKAGTPGVATTMKWEDDGAWLGECMTRNTGESPNVAVVSRLSQILEETPQEKYSLSAKACQGILRRAERRGKDLPETLKAVLLMQSESGGGCDGGGKGALVQEDKSGTLGTSNDQTIFQNCLTQWDCQSKRIFGTEGASPTLQGGVGGGVNNPAIFCMGTQQGGAEVRSDDRAPTLTAAAGMSGNNQPNNRSTVGPDKPCSALHTFGEVPAVCYQMQGFGDYREGDVASNCKQRDYKDSTDLVVSSVDCRNFTEGGEINGTLQAKESVGQSLNLQNTVRTGMIVRRLTPMECERLQGFPDHWTDIGEWRDSKGKLRKPSDSPRYKALGNSIALPFWDFLAKRISAQYLRPVTMGSLFDGIGGFPLVFERHNGKGTARWASEIEEFPIAVTKLRFGEDA